MSSGSHTSHELQLASGKLWLNGVEFSDDAESETYEIKGYWCSWCGDQVLAQSADALQLF